MVSAADDFRRWTQDKSELYWARIIFEYLLVTFCFYRQKLKARESDGHLMCLKVILTFDRVTNLKVTIGHVQSNVLVHEVPATTLFPDTNC